MRIFAYSLVMSLLGAAAAHAQTFDVNAAKKHFDAAQDAFAKKHFKVAAGEFQAAYDITKDPVVLYNVGEAWQKGGDGKKAVAAYKAYLKAQPNAQDAKDVHARIKMITAKRFKIASMSAPGDVPTAAPPKEAAAVMPFPSDTKVMPFPSETPPAAEEKKTLTPSFGEEKATMAPSFGEEKPGAKAEAEGKAPPPSIVAPPPPEAAPPGLVEERPVSKMRVAAWVGVATTVAVLTAGAIFALAAESRGDEISRRFTFVDANGQPRKFDASAQSDYHNLKDEGELYNALGIGFFAAAGALAVVTTVLFVVDAKRAHETQHAWHVAPGFSRDGAALAAGWSF
jgi:hypothetical protein